MDFSSQFLKAKQPCAHGLRWYLRNRLEEKTYQDQLDALVAAGRIEDACWLLTNFGPTSSVLELDALDATAVVFAGTLRIRGPIEVDTLLCTGRGIQADGGLRVGGDLLCGDDLSCAAALQVGGRLRVSGRLQVGWSMTVGGTLDCDDTLRCGWHLDCGEQMRVGGDLWVGTDLSVRGGLEAGKGLSIGGDLSVDGRLRAGCGIDAGGTVRGGSHLEVGHGIRAGGAILADGAIRAGESLIAGSALDGGRGYGIYAGLDVCEADWETSARVCASRRPDGLRSGHWAGDAVCPAAGVSGSRNPTAAAPSTA